MRKIRQSRGGPVNHSCRQTQTSPSLVQSQSSCRSYVFGGRPSASSIWHGGHEYNSIRGYTSGTIIPSGNFFWGHRTFNEIPSIPLARNRFGLTSVEQSYLEVPRTHSRMNIVSRKMFIDLITRQFSFYFCRRNYLSENINICM